MTATAPTPAPFRFPLHAWIMAAVLFAGAFTLGTRHHDFPYSYHPDESGKVGQIIRGSRNYHHPLLLLSVTDIAARAGFVPRTPQAIVETGRGVSAAFAAGTVVALALLAWMRYGALAGWGAGLAVALQAELFETAHYLKEDPALVFGLALTLLAAHWWWRAPGWKTLRFLAIACGLAAGGKYIGVIALAVALPLVLWQRRDIAEPSRRSRLKAFAIVFALTFLAANLPLFATTLSSPFRSIRDEVQDLAEGPRGPHGEYLRQLRKDVPAAIGILAGIYAASLLVTARRRTPPEWAALLLPLGYVAIISCSAKSAPRYLLPVNALLPALAIFGAAEIARLIRSPDSRSRRAFGALVLAGLAGWLAVAEWSLLRETFDGFRRDDPTELAEWVKANLPPEAVIAEDHRANLSPAKSVKVDKQTHAARKARGEEDALEYEPAKDARIPQKIYSPNFAPDLGTLDGLRKNGVTHVAICKKSYERYFADETKPRDGVTTGSDRRRKFYARVRKEGTLLKEWPAGTISYLQPGIELYRIAPPSGSPPP